MKKSGEKCENVEMRRRKTVRGMGEGRVIYIYIYAPIVKMESESENEKCEQNLDGEKRSLGGFFY